MSSSSSIENTFMAAYEAHNDAIFRFCIVKTRNRELALDLTQEAFTKTWEYISLGNDIENIRAFLYRVAHNLIIDNSRKKKSLSLDSLQEDGFDPSQDDTHRVVDQIDGKQAVEFLSKLDDKYRDVLTMRYVDQLSITEIADILGEKENTVSVRIHRGLDKMKKLYE